MAYSTVTATTGAVIPAADINKLMEDIDLVKGGTAGVAPTTTVEDLSSNKMSKITPADGKLLQSDENGTAEATTIDSANVTTASAVFATDEIILGAGADRTLKKSGYTLNNILPVGFTYIQFPGDSSPSTLNLIGTWTNVSSELAGDFIRFEGGSASAFEAGQQTDAGQGHRHKLYAVNNTANTGGAGINFGLNGASIFYTPNGTPSVEIGNNGIQDPVTDGVNGTPRTASETRPVNRTVRKWRRTA